MNILRGRQKSHLFEVPLNKAYDGIEHWGSKERNLKIWISKTMYNATIQNLFLGRVINE
jgi:hypothetical protein